ncbi:uncharacterized protein [Melopsittacus undulatus]|uniref:uncharacterized protein n=1 Tax=Melopsittacus undulatus TaxID=13146 RepID=UPI00146A3AD3|nr:uncharacterized protein LOC115947230 [Melopsittacus undulatus]
MDPNAEIKKQVNPFLLQYLQNLVCFCTKLADSLPWIQTQGEALKAHGIVNGYGEQVKIPVKLPDYVQMEPERCHGQTLQEQLNTCKDSEPALGLDYIIEYRSKENSPFLYEFQLCHCKTGLSNMFMHVCGSKHRLAYLKQHYPEIAESGEVKGKGSELNRKVKQLALKIEKKEGRKQIKVPFFKNSRIKNSTFIFTENTKKLISVMVGVSASDDCYRCSSNEEEMARM